MHDTKKSERLHELERLLLGHPGGVSVQFLADRLQTHRSTIYRYLDELSQQGVPIVHDDVDELWWIDTTRYLNNVRLRADESLVLYLAARRLTRQSPSGTGTVVNALEKLATALRQPMAQHLARATQRLLTQRARSNERIWQTLTQAWVEQRAVRIAYRKSRRPIEQAYTLHPYLFEPHMWGDGNYVIGYCAERDALRTFKVERITSAELTGERFTIPPALDADTLLRHAWGIWYEEDKPPLHVRLWFHADVAERVRETVWHPSQTLTPAEDGGVYWEVDLWGELELLNWVRSWGPDVVVLEPESLRRRVADDLRRAAKAYENEIK